MNQYVIIDTCLLEGYPNKSTLVLLEEYLEESGKAAKDFKNLVRVLSSIRSFKDLVNIFHGKEQIIRGALDGALTAIDPFSIPPSTDNKTAKKTPTKKKRTDVTKRKAPKNKKEAENILLQFYLYIKDKLPNLSLKWKDVKTVFYNVYAGLIKILEAAGIMSVVVVLGPPAFLSLVLAITVMIIVSAYGKTSDVEDPSLRIKISEATKNILNGIKRMFTSFDLNEKETTLAIVSTVLVGLWLFVLKSFSWAFISASIMTMLTALSTGQITLAVAAAGAGAVALNATMWLIPVVGAIYIIYLFMEIVNDFALKKVRKTQ